MTTSTFCCVMSCSTSCALLAASEVSSRSVSSIFIGFPPTFPPPASLTSLTANSVACLEAPPIFDSFPVTGRTAPTLTTPSAAHSAAENTASETKPTRRTDLSLDIVEFMIFLLLRKRRRASTSPESETETQNIMLRLPSPASRVPCPDPVSPAQEPVREEADGQGGETGARDARPAPGLPGVPGQDRSDARADVIEGHVERSGGPLGPGGIGIDEGRRRRLHGEHPDTENHERGDDGRQRMHEGAQDSCSGDRKPHRHDGAPPHALGEIAGDERRGHARDVDQIHGRDERRG